MFRARTSRGPEKTTSLAHRGLTDPLVVFVGLVGLLGLGWVGSARWMVWILMGAVAGYSLSGST